MATKRCVECGEKMVEGDYTLPATYKGSTVQVAMHGWQCQSCGESIGDRESQDRFLAIGERLRIVVDGLLAPEEVTRIRERLGMSQREASAILGGGPNAFQKYESGEVRVSLAMSNLLRVLDATPKALEAIRRRHESNPNIDALRRQAS